MTDPSAHINYSLADIERYLNGSMTAKEMHDLEKVSLHDTFLADAIEGYSNAPLQQSHKHLNEINALLQKDNEEAKVIAMPFKKFQWLRIAAMLIVVAGAGFLSWYIIKMNSHEIQSKNVAALTKNYPSVTDTNASLEKADTTTIFTDEAKQSIKNDHQMVMRKEKQDEKKPQETASIAMTARSPIEISPSNNEDSAKIPVAVVPALTLNKSNADTQIHVPLEGRAAFANVIKLNNFSGLVTDNNKQPIANAMINAGSSHATFTDQNGYFNIQAPDSTLQVLVSSIGFQTVNTKLAKNYSNNITIAPAAESLSEVVVIGYGSRKKKSLTNLQADSTFPAGGWESFQEYVYHKMKQPFDSANEMSTAHGDIEIEFDVDNNGGPYNFRILKSLDKTTDEKVIDALRDGPRWNISRKSKKAKVVIRL